MSKPQKFIIVAGLAAGAVLGMLGTLVSSQRVRNLSWALDSTGLIVATCLLALFYFRKGKDFVAAGFLVYAIGEAVMLGGTAGNLQDSMPAFAAGTALWSAGLLLTSFPPAFVMWGRLVGTIAGVLFAIVSLTIFAGHPLSPVSRPLPYFAYPFLVLTFIGWIWTVLKRGD